jgi:hypothetical protein
MGDWSANWFMNDDTAMSIEQWSPSFIQASSQEKNNFHADRYSRSDFLVTMEIPRVNPVTQWNSRRVLRKDVSVSRASAEWPMYCSVTDLLEIQVTGLYFCKHVTRHAEHDAILRDLRIWRLWSSGICCLRLRGVTWKQQVPPKRLNTYLTTRRHIPEDNMLTHCVSWQCVLVHDATVYSDTRRDTNTQYLALYT